MERAIVDFRLRAAELVEQAKAAIDDFVSAIERQEPGTLRYASMQDTEERSHFVHYMEFQDKESHQYHRTTEHVQAFVSKLYPLCEEEPRAFFLEVYREIERS